MNNLHLAIAQHGVSNLNELIKVMDKTDRQNCGDLHNMLYNEDYFVIGAYRARTLLGDYSWNAIADVRDYEKDNFGEVTTDLSRPEAVANMYAYITGELYLNEALDQTDPEDWDNLTVCDLKAIRDYLMNMGEDI